MSDPVGSDAAIWVDHRTFPQQLFDSRTRSICSVFQAAAKEFSDCHLQKCVESDPKKLLHKFKDTVFNSERNISEGIRPYCSKTGPEVLVKLELNEGSKPVAFSPIRGVGLRKRC